MSLQDEHDIATTHPDVKAAYTKLTDAITDARTSMTAQGKPDTCPSCGSDERSKCNLLPTPAGYEDLCCDDWHSSPVPAARNVSAPNPRQVVTDAIREHEPKPTQLLALLSSQLSYGKIQDIVSKLLESGTVEFGSDRRLRMVLRERPVPDKAESVPSGKQPFEIYDEFLQQYSDSVATNCQPPDVLLVWMEKWAIYYAASQTAALTADRDKYKAHNEAHVKILSDTEQLFKRESAKVAELERSNSLLRERLSAIEKLARENERDGYGYCKNCAQLAPDHDENCWLAILLKNKENQ